jgi:hypothetical protein
VEKGNLASGSCPRIGIVWEGAVAICTDDKKFRKLCAKDRYPEALDQWVPVEMVARKLGWLFHKRSVNVTMITYLMTNDRDAFREAMAGWLSDHGLPFQEVINVSPEVMARTVAFMPDLVKIYDPEPGRWSMYGSKGEFLRKVEQIGAQHG